VGVERERIAELYKQFGPVVYRRCLRLLSDREAARDATQEVFVKLLKKPERLSEGAAALPWIFGVATNHCLNLRRDARRHAEQLQGAELEGASYGKAESLPDRALAAEVLARTDATTRAVAVGVLLEEKEHQEVASELGLSRKTVSRKLDRFLLNARKFLSRSES
jgi:RNA polymerase sigma-70 factor (ECF subfamily)